VGKNLYFWFGGICIAVPSFHTLDFFSFQVSGFCIFQYSLQHLEVLALRLLDLPIYVWESMTFSLFLCLERRKKSQEVIVSGNKWAKGLVHLAQQSVLPPLCCSLGKGKVLPLLSKANLITQPKCFCVTRTENFKFFSFLLCICSMQKVSSLHNIGTNMYNQNYP